MLSSLPRKQSQWRRWTYCTRVQPGHVPAPTHSRYGGPCESFGRAGPIARFSSRRPKARITRIHWGRPPTGIARAIWCGECLEGPSFWMNYGARLTDHRSFPKHCPCLSGPLGVRSRFFCAVTRFEATRMFELSLKTVPQPISLQESLPPLKVVP